MLDSYVHTKTAPPLQFVDRLSHDHVACALAGTGGVSRALETGRARVRRTTASTGRRQGEPP
jgi:hypothetical protein